MFLDHKKFAVAYSTAPTIVTVDDSQLSIEANEGLQNVTKVYGGILEILENKIAEITDTVDGKVTPKTGFSLEYAEIEKARKFIVTAKTQIGNIITAEYCTLTKMTRDTKLSTKVDDWFMDITVKAARMSGEIADFITESFKDYLDGVENTDDKESFLDVFVTKLYIAIAKAVSLISDVCYDAERVANKLLSWLS